MSAENYYTAYGLNGDPFFDSGNEKNIFLTPQINRRLKQIRESISTGAGVILVTSLPGAGKSLLAEKLPLLKEKSWDVSLVKGKEDLSSEVFASRVLMDLTGKLTVDEKMSVSLLHKHLDTSSREEKRPVIIVDDADKLSTDMLLFLFQLADLRFNETAFRIVLFANDSISEQLSKPALTELSSGNTETIFMPGFSYEQVLSYMKFRVAPFGEWDDLGFEDDDIERFYLASGGLPGGINILARSSLEQKLQPGSAGKGNARSMMLFSFLVLAVVGLMLFQGLQTTQQAPAQVVYKTAPVVEDNSSFADLSASRESLSLKLSEQLAIGSNKRDTAEMVSGGEEP